MKQFNFLKLLAVFMLSAVIVFAQQNKPRPSLHANVTQTIGVDTDITIDYSRPGVKGRTIWGGLVPYGMAPGNQNNGNKPIPWRGGANENTTFEVTKDVLVEGKKLAAGKYSLHFIPGQDEWTVIINKENDKWGSYQYNEAMDALRLKIKPVEAPFKEWLEYGFDNLAGTSCEAFLHWEKLKIAFKVAVAE